MKLSDIPANKFPIPFANAAGGGYINTIPQASQIGIVDGKASLTDGFPPLTFQPVGSGGVPPFGQDFNGLLKQITQWNKWQNAGGFVPYDGTFSTAIGGYPKTSVLASASTAGLLFVSTADDNTNNPDSVETNWKRISLVSDVQNGSYNYAVAGGTANAITATFTPAITSPVDGMEILVKIASPNTGSVTLNSNAVILENGSALTGGELQSGVIYGFKRNGSNWVLSSSFVAAAKVANTTNLIYNPLFRINQDAFAGGAVSAGTYAIDMWGAPTGVASNMSFSNGVATIASGNMKQIVEDPGYALGSVTLAWNGTATGSVNGGAASASPITFTHSSGNISVVFGTGTVSRPMMAQGTAPLPFVAPSLLIDKLNCFRYYFVNTDQLDQYAPSNLSVAQAQGLRYYVNYPTTMRIQAPVTLISYTLVDRTTGTPSPRADYAGFTMRVDVSTGSGTAGVANLRYKADARIAL